MNTVSKEELDRKFIIGRDGSFVSRRTGNEIRSINHKGYRIVNINRRLHKVHRLIYFYFHGIWPKRIDHKDQNKRNNAIDNLRPITNSLNMANNDKHWNMHGYRGVHSHGDRFRSEVVREGKRYKSKLRDTAEEAHQDYLEIRARVYPELGPTVGGHN